MKKNIIIIIFLFCSKIFSEELTIMTEELRPLSYTEKGKLKGASLEIVSAILKKMNYPVKIVVLPWARGYRHIQKRKNHILFSMARTKPREKMFKWVGPLVTSKSYFYMLKSSGLKISTFYDARKLKTILIPRNYPEHKYLIKYGFNNLYPVKDVVTCFKMLKGKRGELTTCLDIALEPTLLKAGVEPSSILRTDIALTKMPLYIAFSKDIKDEEIKKWQNNLDMIKASPFYHDVIRKYFR